MTFIRYIRVDFTFGLLDCIHYNEDFVISRFLKSSRGTKRLVSVYICLVEGNSAGIFVSRVSPEIFVIKEK